MKRMLFLASVLFLLAGLAVAGQSKKEPAKPTSPVASATKTHDVKGVFVSVDAKAGKLTFKDDKGNQQTVLADTKAISEAKGFKRGDLITLTCRDNDKGVHQAVSEIHARKT